MKGAMDALRAQREARFAGVASEAPDVRIERAKSVLASVPSGKHEPSGKHRVLVSDIRAAISAGASDEELEKIVAAALGRRGGKASADRLSDEQRSKRASDAAKARWG